MLILDLINFNDTEIPETPSPTTTNFFLDKDLKLILILDLQDQ